MIEMHGYASMSSNGSPFKKTNFTRHVIKFGEEDQKDVMFPLLVKSHYATSNFDLWMLKGAHDIFAFITFLRVDWEWKHIIVSLFETMKVIT